jgi:hypothetical protein
MVMILMLYLTYGHYDMTFPWWLWALAVLSFLCSGSSSK